MSRETDNPSPTPPRPSGGAYPSGTPPYGMPSDPAFSRAGQPQPPEPAAEEPRTETTLTTRIRINIPGSRPIPEVVVRSPLGGDRAPEADPEEQDAAVPPPLPKRRHRSDAPGSPVLGVMEGGAGTAAPPDLPAEWQVQGPPASAAAPGAPAADTESSAESSTGTWFVPRKKARQAPAPAPAPAEPPFPAPGQAPAPGPGQAPAPAPGQSPAAQQQPVRPPQPFETEPQYQSPYQPPQYEQPFDQRFEAQFAPQPDGFPPYEQPGYEQPVFEQPAYEQTEQTQQTPLPPPQAELSEPTERAQGYSQFPGFTGGLTAGAAAAASAPSRPAEGFDAFEATAAMPLFRDDAATGFAPQTQPRPQAPGNAPKAAPKNPAKGSAKKAAGKGGDGSVTGNLKVPVPAAVPDGYAGGTGGAGAPPRKPEPATSGSAQGGRTARPRKGGRARKLAVTGIGVLVLAGAVAYGAGLMLNQADVPKGTTVLGYSIGGDTRDNAVNTLNQTVGKLATQPLQLSVNGRTTALDPTMAGLTVDTTATEQAAAHHSYNPVTVIESLLDRTHAVAPVVVIDPDKLRYALQQISAGSGSAREGSVHFDDNGTVVTVLPQPGQALDLDAAVTAVQKAYRARADGVADRPIQLALTTAQPKASAAQVQQAASTTGAWAMSHLFTVKAGSVKEDFGHNTFSKALSLQPGPGGALVPVFDLGKLSAVYGPAFQGVQIEHNGVLGPVTPQDIAAALTQLLSKPNGPTTITLSTG